MIFVTHSETQRIKTANAFFADRDKFSGVGIIKVMIKSKIPNIKTLFLNILTYKYPRHANKLALNLSLNLYGHYLTVISTFIGGCGAGRLYCSLSPQGDVHPCVFLPLKVGNLKKEKFENIWLNSELFNALRDRSKLNGVCSKCSFKYICGGCRARASAYNSGDFLASDPGCILVKEAGSG